MIPNHPPKEASPRTTLRIVASGICCALGYTAAATDCALRAGMDHFQESDFMASGGESLRVARLPDVEHWGATRLALWVRHAVLDCLDGRVGFDTESVPLILLTLERERPHGLEHEQFETALLAQKALEMQFHPQSRVIAGGRAGLGQALQQAAALMEAGHRRQVLLVGVDSYLNAASINYYLSAERLLTTDNSDGFLPGEGAAAILLEAASSDLPGVHVLGVGRGQEPGRPNGSVPSLAQGLSSAMVAALRQADLSPSDLDFRVSDQNGESFFAREAANALTRVAVPGGRAPATLTTADCVGEIGAATGPLMLAWLARLMPRPDGPGQRGLIHLANDHGERAAVVVAHWQ